MKRWNTLRVRFALWTAGLLFVALALFGFYVYASMSHSLMTAIDETLQSIATQLIAEGRGNQLISVEDIAEEPQYERLREQEFSLRVFNLAGQVTQAYGPYQDFPLPAGDFLNGDQPGIFTTNTAPIAQQPMRIYTTQIVAGNEIVGLLQVAQSLNNVQRTLNYLLITLLIGGPLIAIAAGFGGYLLAARALAPIDRMTRMARAISAQDLSARLNLPATDDEVGRLAATLDSMLARLDSAFHRERQFTADVSHELRTPLSAQQMIIDGTLAQRRTPAEYEAALHDLAQEAALMTTLTEELLTLARNDVADRPAKFEAVNLALLLEDVIDSLRPVAEEKGLQLLDKTPETDAVIQGDSDALIRLFVNLLDNAIKYTLHGSITIASQPNGHDEIRVTIRDTGIGIPSAALPYIFDRFYRVDKSRSQHGIGLGLAIAQSIARAHGGEITVASELGVGTTFTVRLPVASGQVSDQP